VLILLPIGFARIVGVILAILTFIALSSVLATLPDSSYIKTVITTFVRSVTDMWDALWPG
jgi:hypothetical protein